MDAKPLDVVIRNIDMRLERVEQMLPALATKAELREEGERTRRHFDVVAEQMEGRTRLLAEVLDAHRESTDRRFGEADTRIDRLDRRVTRLEAKRR